MPMARVPSLPSSPPDPRRAKRIERTRKGYAYRAKKGNLLHPISSAESYPWSEWYTPAYVGHIAPRWIWAMGRRYLQLAQFAVEWASFRFDKMQAYRRLLSRPLPAFAAESAGDGQGDDDFAWWRIAGANPLSLARAHSLDALRRLIPLDLEHCQALLARNLKRPVALADEAQRGRLFYADFRRIQQSLRPARDPRVPDPLRDSRWREKYQPSPIGVFLEAPERPAGLAPLAIQIDQPLGRGHERNGVYYPDGDDWGWRIAKLYFEVADVSFQLSCGHIFRTHLTMEPFALATPRQLAREHPIRILLRAHLRFTLQVNRAAYDYYRKRKELYFEIHAGTLEEMREIAIQSHLEEDFPALELEAELARRGVDRSPELYPYREDARLWLAPIREFVESYVHAFYPSDQAVAGDSELQAWANELMNPPPKGCKPRKLVEGDSLDTREKLIGVLAQVLFTAGPGHASQHYSSTHYYRYAPVFPAAAYLPPTWTDDSLNEARLQNMLPPIRSAARQWTYNTFTNFRIGRFGHYGFHRLARLPEARPAILRLQEQLRWVEDEIERRNSGRPHPYPFLLPSQVPNSIHI
jgi:arachidonate 15-lipoxygenase